MGFPEREPLNRPGSRSLAWWRVRLTGSRVRRPPGASWMQGAAGIAAFLLRLARVMRDGLTAPVVDRPDQWWAVPAGLRTVHTGPQN